MVLRIFPPHNIASKQLIATKNKRQFFVCLEQNRLLLKTTNLLILFFFRYRVIPSENVTLIITLMDFSALYVIFL